MTPEETKLILGLIHISWTNGLVRSDHDGLLLINLKNKLLVGLKGENDVPTA